MRTNSLVYEYVRFRATQGRSLSPRTVQGYLDALSHLGAYYPPSEATVDTAVRRIRSFSLATEKSYLRRWKTVATYAAGTHSIPSPFASVVERPAAPHPTKRVFTLEEYARLSAACRTVADTALVDLLFGTGLRIGEVPLFAWQVGKHHLQVTGKTGERYCAIHSRDRDLLLQTEMNGLLWFGKAGKTALQSRWRRVVDRAGVSGPKKGPHTARRTFASTWIANGGSIEALSVQLGHKSIRTTQLYVAASPGWVMAQMQGNDPLGSLKKALTTSDPDRMNDPGRPTQESDSFASSN